MVTNMQEAMWKAEMTKETSTRPRQQQTQERRSGPSTVSMRIPQHASKRDAIATQSTLPHSRWQGRPVRGEEAGSSEERWRGGAARGGGEGSKVGMQAPAGQQGQGQGQSPLSRAPRIPIPWPPQRGEHCPHEDGGHASNGGVGRQEKGWSAPAAAQPQPHPCKQSRHAGPLINWGLLAV